MYYIISSTWCYFRVFCYVEICNLALDMTIDICIKCSRAVWWNIRVSHVLWWIIRSDWFFCSVDGTSKNKYEKVKDMSRRLMEIRQVIMQMWQTADTVTQSAVCSTNKHAAFKQSASRAFWQAEPRPVLRWPLPPHHQCHHFGWSLSVSGL